MRSTSRPDLGLSAGEVRIEAWPGSVFSTHVETAMAIYVRAMNYPAHTGSHRAITARRHANNAGFACRAAVSSDGTLVGFGYGYTTLPGQWWHDLVRNAISRSDQASWLTDAFELSEMHVMPEAQGAGVGKRLLQALAGDITHQAMLLSTPDADTRAFRLYRNVGFIDLARNYLFPGDARPFAVLGARLPLVATSRPS